MFVIKNILAYIFYGCYHDWDIWESWAITLQRRYCKKCGKAQKRDV